MRIKAVSVLFSFFPLQILPGRLWVDFSSLTSTYIFNIDGLIFSAYAITFFFKPEIMLFFEQLSLKEKTSEKAFCHCFKNMLGKKDLSKRFFFYFFYYEINAFNLWKQMNFICVPWTWTTLKMWMTGKMGKASNSSCRPCSCLSWHFFRLTMRSQFNLILGPNTTDIKY